MRTSGHRVLITGGAKGIGLALAKQFHLSGNELILVGRDESALQAAAKALPGSRTQVADVANAKDRLGLVTQCSDITILVNNAGIQRNGLLSSMSEMDIQNEIAINLLAPILLTHAYLPYLEKQAEAAIINVSSALALVPKESASVYCASKAALHSFTQSLRWQLEEATVRVFEIMPPLVDTAMTANRGMGKIAPEALASEFWRAFQKNQYELRIGKAKSVGLLARLSPSLAEKIMRRS